MSNKLSVGDTVQCRMFYTPLSKFYGPYFVGKITKINKTGDYSFFVEPSIVNPDIEPFGVWLKRKEIKRRIKS